MTRVHLPGQCMQPSRACPWLNVSLHMALTKLTWCIDAFLNMQGTRCDVAHQQRGHETQPAVPG